MGGDIDIPELEQWEDGFENQVSDRTNVLDLPGHYPYSQERWRIFVDGSRVFPEYGSVSQYNHAGDYHELTPAAGETVTMESAERPRYVVAYELSATWAFAVNQSLQSGDSIRVGLYDGTDGWYMEHTGDQADDVADFVLERDGSEVYRREDIDIERTVTENARLRLQTAWYDVTRQVWDRSYAEDGQQQNPTLLNTQADGRGTKTGNLPVHFSVTASASTTGLILEAGSAAQVNLGRTTSLTRNKEDTANGTIDVTDEWVPLTALRVDPDRDIVNAQLTDIVVAEFDANDDVFISVQAFDPSNVLDTNGDPLTDADYSVPNQLSSTNSVIEVSDTVEQIPNNNGTTSTSVTNLGGFQVGFAAAFTGQNNTISNTVPSGFTSKRPIYGRDTVVICGKSSSTGDVNTQYRLEQDF